MSFKVIVERRQLQGSADHRGLQRIATVYRNGEEFRIYAPPNATGEVMEWIDHAYIRQSNGVSETGIETPHKDRLIAALREELQKDAAPRSASQ